MTARMLAVKKHKSKALAIQQDYNPQELISQAEALFSSIGEGAIATDKEGRISRVNSVTLQLLGYSADELLGKWFPGTIQAVDEFGQVIPPLERPITRAFLTGKSVTTTTSYYRSDGSYLPVKLTVSPIMLHGKPIGAVEVFRDVSIECEMDKMKSEFISIASHQLRTPLSAMKMYGHMLADGIAGDISPQQRGLLDIIIQSADRMNDLITTLLDLSKMEAGFMNVTIAELNVYAEMQRSVRELVPLAKQKGVELALVCHDKSTTMQSDSLLLGEMFRNLISNAIKYTPSGGKVTFTSEGIGNTIQFRIADTGHGIPENLHDRVFTKFFRGTNITNLDTTGSGLGLYMVKTIADSLGINLGFTSREGKGSVFTLTYTHPEEASD